MSNQELSIESAQAIRAQDEHVTRKKPLTPMGKPKPSCQCVSSNRFACLQERHGDADIHLSKCMGGCSCACHKAKDGSEIDNTTWKRMRKKL